MSGRDSKNLYWSDFRLAGAFVLCLLACALCQTTVEYDTEAPTSTTVTNLYTVSSGSDENVTECPSHTYNKTCCNHREFQCADGHCIPNSLVCNNVLDCPDNSDEDGCLGVPCASRVHLKCEQMCKDLPRNRSRCMCYKGYYFKKVYFKQTCQDINECEIGVHWCSQDCNNLNGSFSCSCRDGYEKSPDGYPGTCKATNTNIQVLYSSDAWIYSYSVEKHKVSPVVHAGRVDEMDFDPATNIVYWSTRHRVGRSYLPGAKEGKVTVGHPQSTGSSSIWHIKNSLAIDWTAGNLYWISVDILNIDKYQILVSKLDGRYVKTIVDDVTFASSLVVDPEHGKMYWTSGGDDAEIGTAWMNGMYRRPLVKLYNAKNPTALTLDHMAGRLFWADSKLHCIYAVLTDGTRPSKIITLSSNQKPLMMDVFENYLYWVTGESRQLVKHDKFGRGTVVPLVEQLINQTAIKVYHPKRVEVEIRRAALYCRNQCSHLCLHVPRGYSCSCPDGSKLLLQGGEMICDSEQEDPIDDPLVCDCTNKDKICNATLPEHRCHCPGVECKDGVTQSPEEYPESTDDDDEEDVFDDYHHHDSSYPTVIWTKILVFFLFVTPVFICCGLSFCKRPERNTSSNGEGLMTSSIGFNSEQDTMTEGYAQGGATIVKSNTELTTKNNGVDNPLYQAQESHPDLMSSRQLLIS